MPLALGDGRRISLRVDASASTKFRRDKSACARMLPPTLGCFRLRRDFGATSPPTLKLRRTGRRDKPVFAHGRCRPPFSAARASGLAGLGSVSLPGTGRGGTPLEPAAGTAAPQEKRLNVWGRSRERRSFGQTAAWIGL
jgi:hypothetical protein